MKKNLFILFFFLISFNVLAQNGVYQSSKFEFISQNDPTLNRVKYVKYNFTFQIDEFHGEFIGGKILWEMKSENNDAAILEMNLKSVKNSHFDESNNAFIKIYEADIKLTGQIIAKADVYVWKFISKNSYRVDMYDPVKKTINRFDNIVKL